MKVFLFAYFAFPELLTTEFESCFMHLTLGLHALVRHLQEACTPELREQLCHL